jgi:transcriptional regulator with XRE-family HTH domain
MNDLGKRIEQALLAIGANQAGLASACEVTPGAVTQWKSGKTKMSAAAAIRAASFLNVNVLWLTEGAGPMRPSGQAVAVSLINPEDQALLDDLRELLPEDAVRYRQQIRAEADKARRYRGKPVITLPPAVETADFAPRPQKQNSEV